MAGVNDPHVCKGAGCCSNPVRVDAVSSGSKKKARPK